MHLPPKCQQMVNFALTLPVSEHNLPVASFVNIEFLRLVPRIARPHADGIAVPRVGGVGIET